MSARDFRLWERELKKEGIVSKFPPAETVSFTPAILLLGLCVTTSMLLTDGTARAEPQIADPATFSYSYGIDEAAAIIPTPNSEDGAEYKTLLFSCGSDGTLVVDNVTKDVRRLFNPPEIGALVDYEIISKNPCDNGISFANFTDLGNIVLANGLGTYYTTPIP